MNDAFRNLTPAELWGGLEDGSLVVVDVREPQEFAAARIPGALNLPLSIFDPAALPEGTVILQCGVGKRSLMAAQLAAQAGRPVAGHLATGLQGWMQAGLPVER